MAVRLASSVAQGPSTANARGPRVRTSPSQIPDTQEPRKIIKRTVVLRRLSVRAQVKVRRMLLEARGQEESALQRQFGNTDIFGKVGNRNVHDELNDLAQEISRQNT